MFNSYYEFVMAELSGLYGEAVLNEMYDIIKLYDLYEGVGAVEVDQEEDYTPTQKKTNFIKKLINCAHNIVCYVGAIA